MTGEFCGCNQKKKYVTLVQGGVGNIVATVFVKFPTAAYDFTQSGLVDVEARFPTLSGVTLVKLKSASQITIPGPGQIAIALTQDDVNGLIAYDPASDAFDLFESLQSFIVFITDSTGRNPVQFNKSLLVLTSPAP